MIFSHVLLKITCTFKNGPCSSVYQSRKFDTKYLISVQLCLIEKFKSTPCIWRNRSQQICFGYRWFKNSYRFGGLQYCYSFVNYLWLECIFYWRHGNVSIFTNSVCFDWQRKNYYIDQMSPWKSQCPRKGLATPFHLQVRLAIGLDLISLLACMESKDFYTHAISKFKWNSTVVNTYLSFADFRHEFPRIQLEIFQWQDNN